jgi:hypothetical protein
VLHDAVAFGSEQVVPQAPQLVVVLRAASQPLLALKSQSPNPPLQAPMVHTPLTQLAPALANTQWLPQAPQLFTSVFKLASQPLVARPSQLP